MGENKEQQSHIPTRLNILFLIVFLFFAAIILRLAYVQLVEGEQYKHALEKYSTRELPIAAPRGRILDQNGEVLIDNKPVYTVTFVEKQDEQIDEEQVADRLAGLLIPDAEKLGTDKELLKMTIELNSSLPVSFGPKETDALIAKITPKIQALPKIEQVASMSDFQLVKAATYTGLRVKSPFDNKDREKVKNNLKKNLKSPNQAITLDEMSDTELLQYAADAKLDLLISLDKEDREALEKEVKAQLRLLPGTVQLKDKTDMDLLRYASLFKLDVALPMTDKQRQFQWHKLSILKEMSSSNSPSYIPRRVKVNISPEEMFRIEERRSELPGVSVVLEPIRQIRGDEKDPIGTHFLGYIKPIGPEQEQEYRAQGYNSFDRVGVTGLEQYYERYLRGKDGVMEVHVNKNSETVEKQMRQPAEPGDDLVLALDSRFQSKVEEILKNQVEELKKRPTTPKEFKDAHALVMNPNTGEILAMASYPDYDLNLYYDQKKFNKAWDTLILPNQSNRFISSAYAPASTFKPMSVMIALQEHLTNPNETIFDRGGRQVGDAYMRNWKPGGHGSVNARRALQVSNNTYMYEMAVRFAGRADDYNKQFSALDYYNSQFGLGIKTGIDLPFENSGWENPNSYYGNLAHAFIGQYDLFTPIQLGQYVSTIANGGYRIRPHFVKEIHRGTSDPKKPGQTLSVIEPEVLNRVEIDPKWIKVVQEGMHMVTQPGGTASRAFQGLPFNIAAKTGTAQTGRAAENALMIGFAPYETPKLSFVVLFPNSLRDGTSSSDATGPVARKLLDAYNELYPNVLTSPIPAQTTAQK